MKSICLKLSAFTFLSAIVSILAYLFTDIEVLFWFSIGLVAISIFTLILLLCSKIIMNVNYGINVVFIIVTFISSLVSGFLVFAFGSSQMNINDFSSLTIEQYVFVGSVLACVISIMILLARCIFVTPKKTLSTEIVTTSDSEKGAS